MPFDYRSEYQRYQQYYLNLRRFYEKPVAKVSIFVVISFMTVSFFSLFAIKPTLVTIGQLIREIEDKREINGKLEEKLVDLQRAQAEYASVRDIVPLVFQAMPTEPAVASLLMEMEVAAVKNQVIIISLQMQPVTLLGGGASQKEVPEKINFTITAGGSLGQLEAFLASLTKLRRVIVIREANFSEGTPFLKKEGVAVTVGIEGEAYFIPEGGKKNRAG